MTPETIHAFLEKQKPADTIKIDLKKRNSVNGRFIRSRDFDDLAEKNFWRILPESQFKEWEKRQDHNLLKIFSGNDFTKLTSVTKNAASQN